MTRRLRFPHFSPRATYKDRHKQVCNIVEEIKPKDYVNRIKDRATPPGHEYFEELKQDREFCKEHDGRITNFFCVHRLDYFSLFQYSIVADDYLCIHHDMLQRHIPLVNSSTVTECHKIDRQISNQSNLLSWSASHDYKINAHIRIRNG